MTSELPSPAERARTCLFSGHRILPAAEELDRLYEKTAEQIKKAYAAGYRNFLAGGAIGYDMLSSIALLNLKNELPEARLFLVLPHFGHYKRWNFSDRAVFAEVLKRADGVFYLENEYIDGCMQRRNRKMVALSSLCICYCSKTSGGTAYTLRCAHDQGLDVVNLALLAGSEAGEQQSLF